MNRFEYLDALRDALYGLPEADVAAIVADYERRFRERSDAGHSEDDIMASLGDPQKVAAEKRAAHQLNPRDVQQPGVQRNAREQNSFADVVRWFFSVVGLSIFNLFMLVPGMTYIALLFAAFVSSLAFYGAGILVTAASMAGVSGIGLHEPFDHVSIYTTDKNAAGSRDTLEIGPRVLRIESASANTVSTAGAASAASNTKSSASAVASANVAPKASVAVQAASAKPAPSASSTANGGDANTRNDALVLSAHDGDSSVEIDASGVRIHGGNDIDEDDDFSNIVTFAPRWLGLSRSAQAMLGIGMVLGGTLLFLLCLAMAYFTWNGLCRLAKMEFAVLTNI